jgi:hypothetical protein
VNEAPPIDSRASLIKKICFSIAVILVALLVIFVLSPTGMIMVSAYMTIFHADEGFKRAQRTINPEELRSWALQTFKEHSGTNNPEIPIAEIPSSIRNLYSGGPEDAVISQNGGVIIFWGGGFFHWVLEIGDTNFSEPFNSGNEEYPYNFKWTNGIYYSREADWKLQ